MRMPIQVGLVGLGTSLLTLNAAAFTTPQGYAHLPVTFAPAPNVEVVISQQGNAISAKLPSAKTQALGEMPDVPEGSQTIDGLLLQADFNFDGQGDIAVLDGVGYGGVNLFYRLYLWNKASGKFQEYKETISNPTLMPETKTLSTAQRSGPRWYSTDYRFNKGKPYAWTEGMMVGTEGDLYFVKIHNAAGKVIKNVVADTQDASNVDANSVAATRTIAIEKAVLHDKPNVASKTKQYLIKDDAVTLLDYRENDDGSEWFLVRFTGKKVVEKWVEWGAINRAPAN
ncbi:XAC2610-related protein [Thiothrix fructosivorans]|uniref:Uncharacterized protein n=1 Tax=Thiothrix fructosivorans TaxID=111770 RepID=A0A8B0SHC5_9GAMM|nr:hypothetical protein [Thiothrix fructosivorans]MBO0613907.1 hypothetical protein [Thiothrix fructosivorans]QTX10275.1 hypothetical protein J1836_017050 [Thiothrix fructosivorans]